VEEKPYPAEEAIWQVLEYNNVAPRDSVTFLN